MVPLKELQETGLGPSGALDPTEAQVVPSPLQVADVHGQVLQPQTRSLPHRGQLGRPEKESGVGGVAIINTRSSVLKPAGVSRSHSLVVREAQRWELGVLLGKVCQPVDDSGQLWEPGRETRSLSQRHSPPLLFTSVRARKTLSTDSFRISGWRERTAEAQWDRRNPETDGCVSLGPTAEAHLRQEDVEPIAQHNQILRRRRRKVGGGVYECDASSGATSSSQAVRITVLSPT